MPRKPKLPPEIKRIEQMSTGRVWTPATVESDWADEPAIAVVPDARPVRFIPDAQAGQDAANRAKLDYHKAVLVKVGWGDMVGYVPPQVEVVPEGMMVIGEFKTKDGTKLSILKPKPPFRRI